MPQVPARVARWSRRLRPLALALGVAVVATLPIAPTPVAAATAPTFCGSSGSRDGTAAGSITAVQVTGQAGFDRFQLTFSGGVPDFSVFTQDSAMFVDPNSDKTIKLRGSAGISVTLDPTQDVSGTTDIVASGPEIQEARIQQNFESFVTWLLGVSSPTCYRTTILNNPGRLQIDVLPTS